LVTSVQTLYTILLMTSFTDASLFNLTSTMPTAFLSSGTPYPTFISSGRIFYLALKFSDTKYADTVQVGG
jgi:hypothetical protein